MDPINPMLCQEWARMLSLISEHEKRNLIIYKIYKILKTKTE